MQIGKIHTLVLLIAFVLTTRVYAADGEKKRPAQGGVAAEILKHADELGLTADQKAKLEEFAKGPYNILTDEQRTKVRELLRNNAKAKKSEAKPEAKSVEKPADEPKATEDKKTDTKPEDKKDDK